MLEQLGWLQPVLIAAAVVFVLDLIGNMLSFSNRVMNALVTALVFAVLFGTLIKIGSCSSTSGRADAGGDRSARCSGSCELKVRLAQMQQAVLAVTQGRLFNLWNGCFGASTVALTSPGSLYALLCG